VQFGILSCEGRLKVDISVSDETESSAESSIGPLAETEYYTKSESRPLAESRNMVSWLLCDTENTVQTVTSHLHALGMVLKYLHLSYVEKG